LSHKLYVVIAGSPLVFESLGKRLCSHKTLKLASSIQSRLFCYSLA